MKWTLDGIKDAVRGAAWVEETRDGVIFHRFTPTQKEAFLNNPDFYRKAGATSGVRLCFETDSPTLTIDMTPMPGTSRRYFRFDVVVNGILTDSAGNTPELRDVKADYPLDRFRHTFALGDGSKYVELLLPFSVGGVYREISTADGAYVRAGQRRKNTLLYFGDSITQGYDVFHPFNHYTYRLASALDAEYINKAIGGDMFDTSHIDGTDGLSPDYVVIAYGTNDWNYRTENEFADNCKAYFDKAAALFGNAKMLVVLPLWRAEWQEKRAMTFEEMRDIVRQNAQRVGAVIADGWSFVPHDSAYFTDKRLHPNDEGFDCYYWGLADQALPALLDMERRPGMPASF